MTKHVARARELTYLSHALGQAPTPDLLHPSASTRSSPSDSSSPLARSSTLAYSGYVLPSSGSLSDLHWSTAHASLESDGPRRRATEKPEGALGWARVVVDRADKGSIQGAFVVRGSTWHVLPHRTFALHDAPSSSALQKRSTPLETDALVLFKDVDVKQPTGPNGGCALESLPFNADRQHPVHVEGARRTRVRERGPWWVDGPASASGLTADGLFLEAEGDVKLGREADVGRVDKRQDAGGTLGSNLECVPSSLRPASSRVLTPLLWLARSALSPRSANAPAARRRSASSTRASPPIVPMSGAMAGRTRLGRQSYVYL